MRDLCFRSRVFADLPELCFSRARDGLLIRLRLRLSVNISKSCLTIGLGGFLLRLRWYDIVLGFRDVIISPQLDHERGLRSNALCSARNDADTRLLTEDYDVRVGLLLNAGGFKGHLGCGPLACYHGFDSSHRRVRLERRGFDLGAKLFDVRFEPLELRMT